MSNIKENEIQIDDAILRTGRIDRLIYVDAPDHEARKAMFELYLKKRPIEIDINYSELADLTENIVSSDIKEIIDRASKLAAKNDTRISHQEIKQVIRLFRPSISVDVLSKYQQIRSKLEGGDNSTDDNYRPIGF